MSDDKVIPIHERRRKQEEGEWFEYQSAPPHERPTIKVSPGQLSELATLAEQAIIAAGFPIFQRGMVLYRPCISKQTATKGRTTLVPALRPMTLPATLDVMCQSANWVHYNKRDKAWVPCDPPKLVADILLSRAGLWNFKPVAGVIVTPTLRPEDGSVLHEHGYDEETRLFHQRDPDLVLPDFVHQPTREDAERALQVLKDLISEFLFKTSIDEAIGLSAWITPVVRGALGVVPLHAINAPTASSGKSYFVDTGSGITLGRPCPTIRWDPDDRAENDKALTGMLLAGVPMFSIDNCNGPLGGNLLCQAVERPMPGLRRLGTSDMTDVETRSSIFSTGNSIYFEEDMVRRGLRATIDPNMEDPEEKVFQKRPYDMVTENRSHYVGACIAIVRAFILAGRPGVKNLSPLASFEDWSNTVRGALVWLGCADPVLAIKQSRTEDPVRSELDLVISAWRAWVGTDQTRQRVTTGRLIEAAVGLPADTTGGPAPGDAELFAALKPIAGGKDGDLNARRLNTWLNKRKGRFVNGLRIAEYPEKLSNKYTQWLLEPEPARAAVA